jgi:hypothetical protein
MSTPLNKLNLEMVPKPFLQVLRELREGRLRVPRFQRPFVWKQEQMIELLESVYLHYPIGSLLVWRTGQGSVKHNEMIGPVKVDDSRHEQVGFVLDGHQRLTTLMAAFGASEKEVTDGGDHRWRIAYDLRSRTFGHFRGGLDPWVMPTTAFTRASAFYHHVGLLSSSDETKGEREELLQHAQELQDRLRDYVVSLVQLQDSSLADAVRVFGRLNSTGTPLSPEQVFSALSYEETKGQVVFDLGAQIDLILDSLKPYGFDGFNRVSVLRVLLASLGEDIYTTDFEPLLQKHRDSLGQNASAVGEALRRAVELLRDRYMVRSHKALPYAWQAVFLAEMFRELGERPLSEEQLRLLDRWFWLTSTSRAYAAGGSTLAAELIQSAGKGASIEGLQAEPIRPFPDRFGQRSARVRAAVLFLATLEPKNLETGEWVGEELLANGLGDFVTWPGADHTRVGNRLLLGARQGRRQRSSTFRLPPWEGREEAWRSHGVDEEGWLALDARDWETFSRHRHQLLAERERSFLEARLGAPLRLDTSPGGGEEDVDDAD